MCHASSVRVLIVAFTALGQQALAIEHVRLSPSDSFLLCAREAFEKPVFRTNTPYRGSQEIQLPCGSSREGLVQELRGSLTDVPPAQIRIVDTPDGVLLCPFRLWLETQWKKLSIVTEVKNWDAVPGSRNLSPDERAAISRTILKEARTTPLVVPLEAGPDGETARIDIVLWLDAHRLTEATDTEVVVGILGERTGIARLVYGEIRQGRYECLWDSPLFDAYALEMGYRDMDGDGVEDLLLSSQRLSLSTHTPTRTMLTIFDRQGRELTRQEHCVFDLRSGYTDAGGACPITAESIEFELRPDGKRDIVTRGRLEDPPEVSREKVFRYSLVNGRYAVQQPSRRPTRKGGAK